MNNSSIIALLTDFGWDDYFVGVLKGVIASINPQAKVIDISHGIKSFQIHEGAWQLVASYRFFPRDTIFLSVVDPGVGSSRKIILAHTQDYFFISPDNGLLTYVLANEADFDLYEIKNQKYFLTSLPTTFEARDKMAPVAAWLSLGISPEEMGPRIESFRQLFYQPPMKTETEYSGQIMYIDKFGNGITDLQGAWLKELLAKSSPPLVSLRIKNKEISRFYPSYAVAPAGEVFFLIGSLGLIEVAIKEGSAAHELSLRVGDPATLVFKKK